MPAIVAVSVTGLLLPGASILEQERALTAVARAWSGSFYDEMRLPEPTRVRVHGGDAPRIEHMATDGYGVLGGSVRRDHVLHIAEDYGDVFMPGEASSLIATEVEIGGEKRWINAAANLMFELDAWLGDEKDPELFDTIAWLSQIAKAARSAELPLVFHWS